MVSDKVWMSSCFFPLKNIPLHVLSNLSVRFWTAHVENNSFSLSLVCMLWYYRSCFFQINGSFFKRSNAYLAKYILSDLFFGLKSSILFFYQVLNSLDILSIFVTVFTQHSCGFIWYDIGYYPVRYSQLIFSDLSSIFSVQS